MSPAEFALYAVYDESAALRRAITAGVSARRGRASSVDAVGRGLKDLGAHDHSACIPRGSPIALDGALLISSLGAHTP